MEQVFNDSGYITEYDRETKILYTVSKGRINAQVGNKLIDAQIDFIKKNKVPATIADNREMIGTYTMLNDKIANELFPVLIENGVICSTVVVSHDVFGEFATNDLTKKINQLELRTFQSYDEALAYVKSKLGIE